MTIPCHRCAGEGAIFKSRYGGNDPDVWRVGDCEACEGDGQQRCDARGCSEKAVVFNDDGEALCEDCLAEWVLEAGDDD